MNSQVGNAEHKNKKGVSRLTGTVTCWTRLSAETNTAAAAFTISTLLWIPLISSSSFSIRIDNSFPKSILNSAKSCRSLVNSDKNSSNHRRNQNPDKNHKTLEFAPRIADGRDWESDGECEVKRLGRSRTKHLERKTPSNAGVKVGVSRASEPLEREMTRNERSRWLKCVLVIFRKKLVQLVESIFLIVDLWTNTTTLSS